MSLLVAAALFWVAQIVGYRVGLARFNKQYERQLRRIKLRYPPHPGHPTECELYKDLCVTELLLEVAESDLRSLRKLTSDDDMEPHHEQ
jgi:hypothetical protein